MSTATIQPFHDFRSSSDVFVIRLADGRYHEETSWGRRGIAMFDTEKLAQDFIDDGNLIEVEVVDTKATIAASGWVEAEGYCEANYARFQAYCDAEGIYVYSAEKGNFFRSIGIARARKAGKSKVFMEDLS